VLKVSRKLCTLLHSAWKSSPKTGKRLRLDWTKTGKKLEKTRLDKTEKTGKDCTKTGLCGQVFVVKTSLNE
jgi:hypothetical protein